MSADKDGPAALASRRRPRRGRSRRIAGAQEPPGRSVHHDRAALRRPEKRPPLTRASVRKASGRWGELCQVPLSEPRRTTGWVRIGVSCRASSQARNRPGFPLLHGDCRISESSAPVLSVYRGPWRVRCCRTEGSRIRHSGWERPIGDGPIRSVQLKGIASAVGSGAVTARGEAGGAWVRIVSTFGRG